MAKNGIFVTFKHHLKEYASLYIFVSVILLFGVIFGAIIVNSMNVSQKQDVLTFLTQFFGQVHNEGFVNGKDVFVTSYSTHLKFIALIWILGISVIGLPLIIILLFLKGLVIGFTVGFFVNQLGWNGMLLAFTTVFPQNIIVLPFYIVITVLAIQLSIRMIQKQFLKNDREPIIKHLISYTVIFTITAMSLSIASLIEAYGSTYFLKVIADLILKKN